jgi:hypothetical protein
MKNIIRWISEHKLISLLIGLFLIGLIDSSIRSISSPAQAPSQQTDALAQPTTTTTADAMDIQQQMDADLATKQAARAALDNTPGGRICEAHPTWQEDECKELADDQLWITNAAHLGMSYDMLVYLRGEADHANVSDYGDGQRWQYCWDGYTPSCFYDNDGDGRMDAYN